MADTQQGDAIERKLLTEYRLNLEYLWHDDKLRQQRMRNYLTINTLLVVALGTYLSLNPPIHYLGLSMILLGVFCVPLCLIWWLAQARNGEVIRFRRSFLQDLEQQIKDFRTFDLTMKAFYDGVPVAFEHLTDKAGNPVTFEARSPAKKSSTETESVLPRIIAAFWTSIIYLGVLITSYSVVMQGSEAEISVALAIPTIALVVLVIFLRSYHPQLLPWKWVLK